MTMRDYPPPVGTPVMAGDPDGHGDPAVMGYPDTPGGPVGVDGPDLRCGPNVPAGLDAERPLRRSPLAVAAFAVGVVCALLLVFGVWGTAGLTGDSPLLLLALLAGSAALGLCPMAAVLGCVLAVLAMTQIRRSRRQAFRPRDRPADEPWNNAWNMPPTLLGGMGWAVAGLVLSAAPLLLFAALHLWAVSSSM